MADAADLLSRIRVNGAVPRHVAIIMDGNGRWAKARGLGRSEGHRAGAEAIRPVIERLGEHGVEILTLFGFSTENWRRPRAEVQTILRLGGEFIDRYLEELHQRGVQLRHLGDPLPVPRAGGHYRERRGGEKDGENGSIVHPITLPQGRAATRPGTLPARRWLDRPGRWRVTT
mgnify:CR=1 FL=1